jgi:hypothetical protein
MLAVCLPWAQLYYEICMNPYFFTLIYSFNNGNFSDKNFVLSHLLFITPSTC